MQKYLQARVQISNCGVLNCDGAQIPIALHMNLINWALYAELYNDQHLLQFLVFRFLLGRSSKGPNRNTVENCKSTRDYPEAIDQYLEKQIQLESWPVEGCHVSPLMSRP